MVWLRHGRAECQLGRPPKTRVHALEVTREPPVASDSVGDDGVAVRTRVRVAVSTRSRTAVDVRAATKDIYGNHGISPDTTVEHVVRDTVVRGASLWGTVVRVGAVRDTALRGAARSGDDGLDRSAGHAVCVPGSAGHTTSVHYIYVG